MIFTKRPPEFDLLEIPSLASRQGSARLDFAIQAVGEEKALAAAKAAGPYLLADELCRRLRLEGLELGEEGELKALSAHRWERLPAFTWPEGAEPVGVLLPEEQAASLRRFVGKELEPAELWRVAEHFFFEEPLKLVVRYTGPRFKAP